MAKTSKQTGIEYIKDLLGLMEQFDLSELEIDEGSKKVKLKRTQESKITYAHPPVIGTGISMPVPITNSSSSVASIPETLRAEGEEVKSPMVGTFYSAPSPGKPPYVEKGSDVKEGEILCIVEAMKIMNEIKSSFDGKVVEILVENGEAVEYGQPLFIIQKN